VREESLPVLEVEVFGAERVPGAPSLAEVERLCGLAAAAAGVKEGHLAIEYVDSARIAALNAHHRGKHAPTDVLSFPIDGPGPIAGPGPIDGPGPIAGPSVPRELGDVVVCPERTADLREAIVHGVLHLLGMDHETDDGEMLRLQERVLGGSSL
jgi:probable rRNA maturation factor